MKSVVSILILFVSAILMSCMPDQIGSFHSPYSSGQVVNVLQLGSVGAYSTFGNATAVDSSGNLFVTGYSNANLSSCEGNIPNCTGASFGASDYYISKYSASGTWQWTRELGQATKNFNANAVTTDSSGNVYIAGGADGGIANCNGVSGMCAGGSTGTIDNFLIKYSSGGIWQWTKTLGETPAYISQLYGMTTDSSDNVIAVGTSTGRMSACGGVSGPCGALTSYGTQDYVILKYSSNGTWQWTQQLGETGKLTTGYGIAVDKSGNIFVGGSTTGYLPNCAGIGGACGATLPSQGNQDYFISKYSSSGVWQWTQQLGSSPVLVTSGTGIAVDKTGNVFVTGQTNANLVNCNGVSGACGGSTGAKDIFVSKYDSNGNWQWTRQLGEVAKNTFGFGAVVDSLGSAYVVGYTQGNLMSCYGNSASCLGNAQGNSDYFILKYDTNGNWGWTSQLGQSLKNTFPAAGTTSISIDLRGYLYVTGQTTGYLPSCNGVSANCFGNSAGTGGDYFVSKHSL